MVELDGLFARWPLESWVQDLTGEPEAPLEELSAGRWLLKLAGLGRYGREKLALAQALGDARLIPPVTGLRHGFLVGPWLEDVRPLPLAPEVDPLTLLDAVATYLAFQTGRHALAAEALEPTAPAEAARLRAEVERYSERLRRACQPSSQYARNRAISSSVSP